MTIKPEEIIGKRFGRLTVISEAGKNKRNEKLWLCECDCGNQVKVVAYSLRNGNTLSCGCLRDEKLKKNHLYKHGEAHSKIHSLWCGMKARCYNKNHKEYKNYGGRGIEVCEEWKDNYLVFKEFLLSNGYDESAPTGQYTIDRINVNGDYCPENCRIVSKKEQNYNKRNSRFITYNGITKTIAEFAEEFNMLDSTLRNRLNMGFSVEEALTKPNKHNGPKGKKHEVNGEIHTIREWAEIIGITKSVLKGKLRRNTLENIVTEFYKENSN